MKLGMQYSTLMREEHGCVVRYYFLQKKKPAEIYEKLKKVYGRKTMG